MAELLASYVLCATVQLIYTLFFSLNKLVTLLKNVQYYPVYDIGAAIFLRNTSQVYVLPELIAKIVHHPLWRFANGTPVFIRVWNLSVKLFEQYSKQDDTWLVEKQNSESGGRIEETNSKTLILLLLLLGFGYLMVGQSLCVELRQQVS